MRLSSARADSEGDEILVYAKLLIPGRGQPIPHAAIGISTAEKKITHVGKQDDQPGRFHGAPSIHAEYLLPGLWNCHTHFAGVTKVDFPSMTQTRPATCGAAITRGFHDTLMAGFTSVRDVGSFAIEAHVAVQAGLILGPNVYGAVVTMMANVSYGIPVRFSSMM